jgi:hypothetical protein
MKQAALLTKSLLQTLLFGIKSAKWIKLKFAVFSFFAFDFLFYSSGRINIGEGINIFLFTALLIISSFFIHQKSINDKVYLWSAFALILSSLNIFYINSSWSYFVYFISFMSFVGSIYNSRAHNIFISFLQACIIQVSNPLNTLVKILTTPPKQLGVTKISNIFPYIILPGSIIIIFATLYAATNSILHNFLMHSANKLSLVENFFDPIRIVTWILFFLFVGVFFITPSKVTLLDFGGYSKRIIREELKRNSPNFPILGLTHELKVSKIILYSLNILLFLTITFEGVVFFSSSLEYSAADLSKMVHSGTNIVTFTIALSVALVIAFFRKNLNFHPKKHLLIKLSSIWLALNSIYVGIVASKNAMYILDFGLTAKRMSVIIYLSACLALLFYAYLKISNKWTVQYFMNKFLATFCIIVLTYSLIDHKAIIVSFAATIQKENIDTKYLSRLCKNRQLLLYKNMDKIEAKTSSKLGFYGKSYYNDIFRNWQSFNYIVNKENDFYNTEEYKNLNHVKTDYRYSY